MLDYERLDVYQCALQFTELAYSIIPKLPRGHAAIVDQLRRASSSIPLNIAEGAGKVSADERAHYHATARGSAMECGSALDVIRLLHVADDECVRGKELLVRIVSMLSKMCR